MLRKGSKTSSLASIHEKIQASLIDHKIGELTDRLYAEEYQLLKDNQVLIDTSGVCGLQGSCWLTSGFILQLCPGGGSHQGSTCSCVLVGDHISVQRAAVSWWGITSGFNLQLCPGGGSHQGSTCSCVLVGDHIRVQRAAVSWWGDHIRVQLAAVSWWGITSVFNVQLCPGGGSDRLGRFLCWQLWDTVS